MKKICWIGPIINKKDYDKYHSQSVAANEWQLNFINSIIKNKRYVINISYVPSPFFPKGPLYVKKHNIVKRKNFKQISIGYLNILFLRDLIIGIKSIFKIINLIRKKLNIQILISYNAEFRNRLVLIFFKKLFNFSSIIILADDYLKGKPNLVIFLSHKYYKLYNGGPKYYFEGGISKSTLRISRNKISDKKIILYSGSQSKLTNLEFTIEIFDLDTSTGDASNQEKKTIKILNGIYNGNMLCICLFFLDSLISFDSKIF